MSVWFNYGIRQLKLELKAVVVVVIVVVGSEVIGKKGRTVLGLVITR